MSQIMKAFTGIFLVLILTLCSTGILGVFFQTMYAQNFHAAIISELEESNYSKGILKEAFERADKEGFRLEVILYQDSDGALVCKDIQSLPNWYGEIDLAQINLWFPVKIGVFQVNEMAILQGYGR